MVAIRPFSASLQDWQSLVEIQNRFEPETKTTLEQIKASYAIFDDRYTSDLIFAERDGVPRAAAHCAEPFWLSEANKKAISWTCVPEESGSDLECTLFQALIEKAKSYDPDRIHGRTLSIHLSQVQLLKAAGFTCRQRMVTSKLDLTACDPKQWREAVLRLESDGIRIVSMDGLSRLEPDWKALYLEMLNRLARDVPSHTAFSEIDMQTLESMLSEPSIDLRLIYVAIHADRWIGVTDVRRNIVTPERMATGFTGVDRDYRRRGVAMGLKARALLTAREQGAKVVRVENDESNPMLQLNGRLGFEPCYDLLLYVRQERPIG